MIALAPPDATSAVLHVAGWTATLVNSERVDAPSGGTLPLCRAIPPTLLTLRVRAPRTVRVRVRLAVPGHAPRRRTVRMRRAVSFTPGGLRLREAAFPPGRYGVRLSQRGRLLARATLRLVPPATIC